MTRTRSNRSCAGIAGIVGVFSLACVQLAAVSLPAARGDDAAGPAVGLTLGPPAVVAVSPPEYGRGDPAGSWWGFFQFPDLWQGNDGSLSVAVHVGANTSLVVAGPDRFLVAYSDFRHRDAEGRPCKAIAVREVVVTARPGR